MGSSISSLVFQPPEVTLLPKKHLISLKSGQAIIQSFYIDSGCKLTVLFSHGNAEDLGIIYDKLFNLSKALQVNVFAYDYEGYGKSSGLASENSCYNNISSAFKYLIEIKHQLPENIVLYGSSLGCGPTCYLAEKLSQSATRVGGIILQSPFLSIFRIFFNFRCTFLFDLFPNIDRVHNITAPVLIIHGTHDEVIPFWNGQELFSLLPIHLRGKPLWIEKGTHNNIDHNFRDEGLNHHIRDFLLDWIPGYGAEPALWRPS